MLLSALTREESFLDNAWKDALAVPLAALVLAIAEWTGRRILEVFGLLVLAFASVAFDSRAYFAEFLLAAVLVGWQLLPRTPGRKASATRILLGVTTVAIAVYAVGSALLVQGFLGTEAQERSQEQLERAGNLLIGGRPEAAASVALFFYRPLGYGAGALANPEDIEQAKNGMAAINYDPENGYVENFMFGQKFELHSVLGDLWAYFGWAGIAFAALSLVLLLRIISKGVADRNVGAVVMVFAVQSLWNLFFNPLYSSAPILALALGLGLTLRARAQDTGVPGLTDRPLRVAR
jgi:hypothetical protein